jgi:hypothetical protein
MGGAAAVVGEAAAVMREACLTVLAVLAVLKVAR